MSEAEQNGVPRSKPAPERKFQDRVDYVAKAIKRGSWGRRFEACFEELDGDQVIAVVMRRAEKNEELRKAIMEAFKVAEWENVPWQQEYRRFSGMSARDIGLNAENVREEKARLFEDGIQRGNGGHVQ